MKAKDVLAELNELADKETAKNLQWFFKTGPGQYGEGDEFLGIKVPVLRKVAKKHRELPDTEAEKLLHSPKHEARMLALFLLVESYRKADVKRRKSIYDLYLRNTAHINNWDLVDCSAHHIVGPYLADRLKSPLTRLAKSKSLWERRIAMIATFHYIKQNEFDETLRIGKLLLKDEHDLIHKAVGWMLREVGNRDLACEEAFLQEHYKNMPRTMLRYAIEKFPEAKRKAYLKR